MAAVSAALAVAFVAGWIALDLGGNRATLWVDDLATPAAAALACVVCVRAAVRHHGRMRGFWALFGCATAFWAFAEIVWGVYALILDRPVPAPSWADAGYLLAIPLAMAALLVHPATVGRRARTARSLFDGLVIATAMLFISWTLVLGGLWHHTDLSTFAGLVAIAYPFGDVLICVLVVMTLRAMSGVDRRSLWMLLAALFAMALSDSVYTYLSDAGSYASGSPHLIDAGWVAAYLGIAVAAATSTVGDIRRLAIARRGPSLVSLVAPLVPVLGALAVATVALKLGHRLDRPAWGMAVGLVGIVLVRQCVLVIELVESRAAAGRSLVDRLVDAVIDAPHDGLTGSVER